MTEAEEYIKLYYTLFWIFFYEYSDSNEIIKKTPDI